VEDKYRKELIESMLSLKCRERPTMSKVRDKLVEIYIKDVFTPSFSFYRFFTLRAVTEV